MIVSSSLSKYEVVISMEIQPLVKIGRYSRISVGKSGKYSRLLHSKHLLYYHVIVIVDPFNGMAAP